MGFFEYLANNLTYLLIVIGAIVLVIAACVAKHFVLKKWEKIDALKKAKEDELKVTARIENNQETNEVSDSDNDIQ